jgi:hypothetical protein
MFCFFSLKICCKCCELGVRAGRDKEDCEPVPVLDEKCSEQFTNCCKKAKSCKKIKYILFFIFFNFLVNCDIGFEMNDDERCRGIFL